MKTGLAYHPVFLEHHTGFHPESRERLDVVLAHLEKLALPLTWLEAPQVEPSLLNRLHGQAYQARFAEAVKAGLPWLDTPDCPLSKATHRAALHAAGGAVDLARQVALGQLDNGLALCRPPGHHAERDMAMGFCFFNNVALAAEWLTQEHGLKRVLIFDFDVHHGNGTQHAFEERPDIFYASSHQDPSAFYPGTGFAEERGRGAGLGYTFNLPLPAQTDDQTYLALFYERLLPRFRDFQPQFVLLSAGYDGHRDDPLGGLNLTETSYRAIAQEMKSLAQEFAGGKIAAVLEGGYHPQRLAQNIGELLEIFLQPDPLMNEKRTI